MRELSVPVPGDVLSTAAEKYGVANLAAASGIYFAKGWALGKALAAGLAKCGDTCDAKSLPAAIESAGPSSAQDQLGFGPLDFTATRHVLETQAQFFTWNTSTKMSQPIGDPVTTG
jgi:hypothetical protein